MNRYAFSSFVIVFRVLFGISEVVSLTSTRVSGSSS